MSPTMNTATPGEKRNFPKFGSQAAYALLFAGWSFIASACQSSDTALEKGEATFVRLCSSCHGMTGKPAALMPGFLRKPQDLTDPQFYKLRDDDQLLVVLRDGKDRMPAFGGLLDEEARRNVIGYLRTLPAHAKHQ